MITTFSSQKCALFKTTQFFVHFVPGQYLKNLCEDALGFVFGLTTNEDGNIFTINSNSRAKNKEGNPTAKGEIDIIEIDVETNSIVRQIELADIIQEHAHHMFSRFFFTNFFTKVLCFFGLQGGFFGSNNQL